MSKDTSSDKINPGETTGHKIETPAQDRSRKLINEYNEKLSRLYILRDGNLLTPEDGKAIEPLKKKLHAEKQKLRDLENDSRRKQKSRAKFKEVIKDVSEEHPEVGEKLKHFNRGQTGRPRLEIDQPELHEAILSIVNQNCSTDERRRTETLNTPTTVKSLTGQLNAAGYKIKRSATYCRLLPKCSTAGDGKRHIQTVPVKILRSRNVERKKHPA